MDAPIEVDNLTATASLRYSGVLTSTANKLVAPPPQNSTPVANTFINSLRSLNSKRYPTKVPLTVDHSLFFTIGLGINSCLSFVNCERVFTDDFPGKQLMSYNYTYPQPKNFATNKGAGEVYRWGWKECVPSGKVIGDPNSAPPTWI
ncbi:hypothetical protein L1887_28834 [Cichorium endivia]|nr:hypothetical protein L1887_28834 [Cichorium endivia]